MLLATCLVQVLLAGCGGGSSTLTPQEQLCDSVSDLQAAAADLQRLSLN